MLEILNYLKARYMSEKAQGMTEYAVVLALVVVIAIAVLSGDTGNTLKGAITNIFGSTSGAVNNAASNLK